MVNSRRLDKMACVLTLAVFFLMSGRLYATEDAQDEHIIELQSHTLDSEHSFEKAFTAKANPIEFALIFEKKLETHGSARFWHVAINGTRLGRLEAHVRQTGADRPYDGFHQIGMAVPADTLRDGENLLTVTGQGARAVVRGFKLVNCSLRNALRLVPVEIRVLDGRRKRPVPARITIIDDRGQLAKFYNARTPGNAVRPGILYTLGKEETVLLPQGHYTLYATRGMEWGVAELPLVVNSDLRQRHTLTISREVDTTGFVACDSHIHTLDGSGHGDSTYPERMITIAGEGIEVAIATDHNHVSDYRGYQRATATHSHFLAIPGDEVTTRSGHFTAFPLDPRQAVPGGVVGRNPLFLESEDWQALLTDMRDKGAEVVLLNHPYWPTLAEGPFAQFRFNRQTASQTTGSEFRFNGIEVAQPANQLPDKFYALNDWFAMLNRGLRITAVGATDSHSVNDPVGQARTYLKSRSDNANNIDRRDVYKAFVEGRASTAAGIFARVSIADRYSMGDLVPVSKLVLESDAGEARLAVNLQIATPSWVRPREAMIYLNGSLVRRRVINAPPDLPTDQTLDFNIELPVHDAHIVAFVLGDSITLPGWTTYGKITQAITNPIYLDVDGDGRYSSPRQTAERLIAMRDGEESSLNADDHSQFVGELKTRVDAAVLVHIKDLLQSNVDVQAPSRNVADAEKEVVDKDVPDNE